jgi:5'-methylthioadenosine/S-adenosylhomocysteine nucleosidase
MKERVMTDPKQLVRMELKNAGFDIDSINVPKRVYLLADDIYDEMVNRNCGEYKYPLGGALYVLKNNPQVGFIKGQMCSPGIATQAEDLVAGGVKEFVHIGLAGGIDERLNVGDIVITDGAYNDTAVAKLYGFDYDFIETNKLLTDEIETILKENEIVAIRGKHWTTDAGYRETWEQVIRYRSKGALCVEMEGAAIAHACTVNQIPFVIIRCLSDCADDSANNTYLFNEETCAKMCADFVENLVNHL